MLTLPIELLEPTKEDHQFLGWYLNDQLVDKLEVGLEGDITLYAKWEQIAYFITFELDGGVCDNLPTKYFIDEITLLPVPTKEGFEFLGWYKTSDFSGAPIKYQTEDCTGDQTYYAKWEIVDANYAEVILDEILPLEIDKDIYLPVEYQGALLYLSLIHI